MQQHNKPESTTMADNTTENTPDNTPDNTSKSTEHAKAFFDVEGNQIDLKGLQFPLVGTHYSTVRTAVAPKDEYDRTKPFNIPAGNILTPREFAESFYTRETNETKWGGADGRISQNNSTRLSDTHSTHNALVKYCYPDSFGNNGFVELHLNPFHEKNTIIRGVLNTSSELKEWNINTNFSFGMAEMREFVRKHKHHIAFSQQAKDLLEWLDKFNARVTKNIQNENDRRGNATVAVETQFESDMMESFTLSIPLWSHSGSRTAFKVDICADATKGLHFWFESDELRELIYNTSREIIDEAIGGPVMSTITRAAVDVQLHGRNQL